MDPCTDVRHAVDGEAVASEFGVPGTFYHCGRCGGQVHEADRRARGLYRTAGESIDVYKQAWAEAWDKPEEAGRIQAVLVALASVRSYLEGRYS